MQLVEVERELEIYRDQLLHAAVPGLAMNTMLHGAEKILDELREAINQDATAKQIKYLVNALYRAMRPITNMLKNPSVTKTSASILIKEAIFSSQFRLKAHNIRLINGIDQDGPDFPVNGSKQMLIASLTNLIDNSIHWLDVRNTNEKLLYIGTELDVKGYPAIVVADNGLGFGNDRPEDLTSPFFTRRNGGMGLGLYIVKEIMRSNNANLLFPTNSEVSLDSNLDGAIVALQFPDTK